MVQSMATDQGEANQCVGSPSFLALTVNQARKPLREREQAELGNQRSYLEFLSLPLTSCVTLNGLLCLLKSHKIHDWLLLYITELQ